MWKPVINKKKRTRRSKNYKQQWIIVPSKEKIDMLDTSLFGGNIISSEVACSILVDLNNIFFAQRK